MSSSKSLCLALAASVACSLGIVEPPAPKYRYVAPVATEVASIPFCPDGSEYSIEGCASVSFADVIEECPHPYKREKGTGACVAKTFGSSSYECGKGMYMERGNCVAELTVPVERVCAKGELTAEGCLVRAEPVIVADSVKPARLSCAIGYRLEGEACLSEISESSQRMCSDGSQLEGGKCVTRETVEPICDKNSSFVSGSCLAIEVTEGIFDCRKGSSADEAGNCLTKVEEVPTRACEKGYREAETGKCSANVYFQVLAPSSKGVPELDCRLGKIDEDGNCYQVHKTDAVFVCNDPFELVKNKCIAYIPVPPEKSCPAGFELTKEGECIRPIKTAPRCPDGFKIYRDVCQRVVKEDPIYVCPKGANLDQKRCKTLQVQPPNASCEHKYELSDNHCILPGYIKAGSDKLYKFTYECPEGFKYNSTEDVCVQVSVHEPEVVCEKGHTIEKKRCVAYHYMEAQRLCPTGFIQTPQGNCSRVTYNRPIFKCPEGSEDHGQKCYIYPLEEEVKIDRKLKNKKLA